jgi:putative ABC transport system permease protein
MSLFEADLWQEILHTIKQNKLRTFLTAFGVFWGILMLILLLGAGKGIQHGVEKTFSGDAQDSMWISARTTSVSHQGLSPGRRVQFTEDDVAALQQLPGIDQIATENQLGSFWAGDSVVTYRQNTSSFGVYGIGGAFLDIKLDIEYPYGRRLHTLDEKESRKVAMIGRPVAQQLFPPDFDPVGEYINVNGTPFRIVGVFYDSGRQGRNSERTYIPMSTFQQTFGKGNTINLIAITPTPGVDSFALEATVMELLKSRHHIAPNDIRAIRINNRAKDAQAFKTLFVSINIFIWFVGLGTLAAGIVGISNIMIITVKDRTTEIGIRKALGATPGSIVSLILLESVGLTTIAGCLGLTLGIGLVEFANHLMLTMNIDPAYFSRPEVGANVAIAATALLVIVGAIAGLVPALKAARITPIEAMRAEA